MHSLGQIFRLAPSGKWNRGREEVGNFCGFLCRGIGAHPALPDGSLCRSRGHQVHANLARCKVCGDGSHHRDKSAFRSSVGQFGREHRQAIVLTIRITIYHPDVLALDIAGFF